MKKIYFVLILLSFFTLNLNLVIATENLPKESCVSLKNDNTN